MATGLIFSETFLYHNSNPLIPHYENSDRLIACMNLLQKSKYYSLLRKPEIKDISSDLIKQIHSEDHLQKIENSKGKRGYFDSDTPFTEKSWISAFKAASSGLTMVDALLEGKIKNGFSLLRPPGHHAERDRIMGFCILNNIAVATKYLQIKGFKKVFILDWDVHHGNGTQEIFYEDPSVFYLSIHQFPFYPMTGLSTEIGEGIGIGTTKNIPLQANTENFKYIEIFKNSVVPTIEKFNPEVILISAGFDAHKKDPLGGMKITTEGFEKLTRIVLECAKHVCQGRVLSFLEGGYDIPSLSESVEAHVAVLNSFS
ncbi:histone deacetylase [Leptospira sp. 201903070]|jgi:acetoin utilization deacetylase AcuC-like enzyme|uniref:Histone deacetylase n=1 Tax=Leptospira ainlahdjerensis TaxID=2810033 RepID=A0ABS2UJF1_9LEPT|nr:histone deacetylase [Leptospira ainlahdjerensis]MBM9579677.1 histone deacetylase [Leptospira ainlahdjerensis]